MLIPALVFWVAELCMRLRPHNPDREALQLRYPCRILVVAHESEVIYFQISALPTSLDVASVNSWL